MTVIACNKKEKHIENCLVTHSRGKYGAGSSDLQIREWVKKKTLQVHTSCYLNVNQREQRLISSPAFHGKPRHDHAKLLIINKVNGEAVKKEYFVKILLLFKFQGDELAYLQYLTKQQGTESYRLINFFQVSFFLFLFFSFFFFLSFRSGKFTLKREKMKL